MIHGDVSSNTFNYDEADSAYNGPMFHTAERLLRESVKVVLTDRGEELMYASAVVRKMAKHLADLDHDD